MNKVIEYLLATLLIIECNTIYIRIFSFSGLFSLLTAAVIFILCIQNLQKKNFLDINKTILYYLFYFMGAILLLLKVYDGYRMSYISKFIILLPMLTLYIASLPINKSRFEMLYKISNIITIEACISILFFVFGTLLSILPATETILLNWGETRYIRGWYHLYFEAQFFRNSGIFTEAPMHNYVLSIAFLTEIFIVKHLSKIKITILTIAILTTLSTTGQLVLIGTIGILMITRTPQKIRPALKLLLIPIGIGLLIILYQLTLYIIEVKSESSSFEVRNNFIVEATENWLSSPILGCGYGSNFIGSSNSIFVLLAEGGIFMFILYFVSLLFIPLLYWVKGKNKDYAYFHLIYWGMFCITIILYCNITLLLIAIPLASFIKTHKKILIP